MFGANKIEDYPWEDFDDLKKEKKKTLYLVVPAASVGTEERRRQKEIEIEFDGEAYPVYFQCWYENGTRKAEGRYKEFLVREALRIWLKDGKVLFDSESESIWNPLVVGYIAFVNHTQLQPFSIG